MKLWKLVSSRAFFFKCLGAEHFHLCSHTMRFVTLNLPRAWNLPEDVLFQNPEMCILPQAEEKQPSAAPSFGELLEASFAFWLVWWRVYRV